MKAIYINRYEGPEKKKYSFFLKFILVLIILGGLSRLIAPYFLTGYINKMGENDEGLRFQVNDLSLKVFDSKIKIGNLRVIDQTGVVVLMELSEGLIDVDPIRLLKKENLVSQHWKKGEVVLSKLLIDQLKSLREKNKSLFIDSLKTSFDEFQIKQMKDENMITLLSLKDVHTKLRNVGIEDLKKSKSFQFDSKIKEGGRLSITGKALAHLANTPWEITGQMTKIHAVVLDKLYGDSLPIQIREADLNVKIQATSQNGTVAGIITPDVKEFMLKDESGSTLKRTVAKVSNYVLKKMKNKDEELTFQIPFTLKDSFSLDIAQPLKKILSK